MDLLRSALSSRTYPMKKIEAKYLLKKLSGVEYLDLSNSDHIIPRYIRSLNNGEKPEELASRLCK